MNKLKLLASTAKAALASIVIGTGALLGATPESMSPAQAQQQPASQLRPNILFIMGDDIGWMQVGSYHRGMALGETPNIDSLASQGGMFMDYYAMQGCTSGRNAFFTGMYPLRTV